MTKIRVPEDTSSVSVDGIEYLVEKDEAHGHVLIVNNGEHAAILTRPPFNFEFIMDEEPEVEDKPEQDMLLGSSILPSMVDVGGETEVQLGVVVARAHAESGLSVADWNELPEGDREDRLTAVVDAMRKENAPDDDDQEETDEVKTLRALDFGGPDFPNKTALVKWLNENGVDDVDDGMGRPVLEGRAGDRRDELVAELTKTEAPEQS